MRRSAWVAGASCLALALSAASGAPAMTEHAAMDAVAPAATVSMGYAAYQPQAVAVLTGDTVRWTNPSVRKHTVTASDGSYDSGDLLSDDDFEHRYTAPGVYEYFCRIHAGMAGEVDVASVLLSAPSSNAAPGRPFPLHGRAAADEGTVVSIQADDGGSGTGWHEVATAQVDDDHAYAATITPSASASYRAVVGEDVSTAVPLVVLNRTVTASAARRRGVTTVTAQVSPAAPGSTVVLQLYLPERFGWWPVERAKLDASSAARFHLRLRRTVRARVRLTLPDGATALGTSKPFRVGPKS